MPVSHETFRRAFHPARNRRIARRLHRVLGATVIGSTVALSALIFAMGPEISHRFIDNSDGLERLAWLPLWKEIIVRTTLALVGTVPGVAIGVLVMAILESCVRLILPTRKPRPLSEEAQA